MVGEELVFFGIIFPPLTRSDSNNNKPTEGLVWRRRAAQDIWRSLPGWQTSSLKLRLRKKEVTKCAELDVG